MFEIRHGDIIYRCLKMRECLDSGFGHEGGEAVSSDNW